MALLNGSAGRRRTVSAVAIALAVALGGCVLFDAVGGGDAEDQGPAFNHRIHVEDQGMGCVDCHMGIEDSDEPGMPVLMLCNLCHEGMDADKPFEQTAAALFHEDALAPSRSRLDDEIIFSHLGHVTAGIDCAVCHGDIAQAERTPARMGLSMESCMVCHAERSAPNDCATCHSEIREDVMPANHGLAWLKVHGSLATAGTGIESQRCTLCHTEDSCSTCHQLVPPEDHTQYWRQRGHGFMAAMDRSRCATCHQPDYCNQCHSEATPSSHTGSWGGARSNHCISCHLPLQQTSCYTCHQSTPSHMLAAPKPPDHNAAMNCRQCHGFTAPLPHVDNGSDCNICHQ